MLLGLTIRDVVLIDRLEVTFGAGLFWSWLFARTPNVWALGLSHGILAALAYPLVLGNNPLTRL